MEYDLYEHGEVEADDFMMFVGLFQSKSEKQSISLSKFLMLFICW